MRIHEYGLWFICYNDYIWTKTPKDVSEIFLNGVFVGRWRPIAPNSFVRLDWLERDEAKLANNVPGYRSDDDQWIFPSGYIPTDADFEVLNENS